MRYSFFFSSWKQSSGSSNQVVGHGQPVFFYSFFRDVHGCISSLNGVKVFFEKIFEELLFDIVFV